MSAYSVKNKGWRYDFTLNGNRYTECWFQTKRAALQAEARKREEVANLQIVAEEAPGQTTATGKVNPVTLEPSSMKKEPESQMQTGMDFLELVNLRLDHVKAYNSESHYETYVYMAKGWAKKWNAFSCSQVTPLLVKQFLMERKMVSAYTANRELRYLRATFNFGKREKLISEDPTEGIKFFPENKKVRYVPPVEDIKKVLAAAEPDIRDYLLAIWDTMARVSEINRLTWDDVSLQDRYVILYTRKKSGGHLTPRKVHLTSRLLEVLTRRHQSRDPKKPWVFWTKYSDNHIGAETEGPYLNYRKTILKTLCKKVAVKDFSFHALRHSGATIMDNANVPTGSIQRILGHENRTTTEIYLHALGNTERDAIAMFESVTEKSHTDSHTESHMTA